MLNNLRQKWRRKRRRMEKRGVGSYALSKAKDNFDFLVYLL